MIPFRLVEAINVMADWGTTNKTNARRIRSRDRVLSHNPHHLSRLDMQSWERLIRFVAAETNRIHIGQPVESQMDGSLDFNVLSSDIR